MEWGESTSKGGTKRWKNQKKAQEKNRHEKNEILVKKGWGDHYGGQL